MKMLMSALSLALVTVGCAPVERSRSLDNPAVPATTIAEQVCASCHGAGGHASSPNFPVLAAQQEQYLANQLKSFRNHGRSDPAGFEYMWGLSRHLSDQQIQALAAYFAAQPAHPGQAHASASAERGRQITLAGVPAKGVPACVGCHGPNLQGHEQFPRLAGQHADYTVKQLMVFQRTDERPDGAVMQVVAHALSEQDMRDVASYLEGL